MKSKYSFYDKKGKLYVDCAQCKRGGRGAKDCSAGWLYSRPKKGGCFLGELFDSIIPSDLRTDKEMEVMGMDEFCGCGRHAHTRGLCKACYMKEFRRTHPEHRLSQQKNVQKWRQQHPDKVREYARNSYHRKHPEAQFRPKTGKNVGVCTLIKQHHEAMKDDPEHLSTEFIKKLIKVDCKDI